MNREMFTAILVDGKGFQKSITMLGPPPLTIRVPVVERSKVTDYELFQSTHMISSFLEFAMERWLGDKTVWEYREIL